MSSWPGAVLYLKYSSNVTELEAYVEDTMVCTLIQDEALPLLA